MCCCMLVSWLPSCSMRQLWHSDRSSKKPCHLMQTPKQHQSITHIAHLTTQHRCLWSHVSISVLSTSSTASTDNKVSKQQWTLCSQMSKHNNKIVTFTVQVTKAYILFFTDFKPAFNLLHPISQVEQQSNNLNLHYNIVTPARKWFSSKQIPRCMFVVGGDLFFDR